MFLVKFSRYADMVFEDHHICYLCSSLIAYRAAVWTVRSVPTADTANIMMY